jgi:chromosome segregation protein
MFLKSLVLRGFKSFAERTSLAFQPGVSVVVGPNGSGKSNIVDAICWVLGEQGPSSLRGGKMEDVIFAGSGSKPALGMAEVELVIDNSAHLLPVEYNEVSISRTLFRSGESEYRLNGAPCRLLDIQELLSDAGIGREQHTIVGQGRLDDVLTADPARLRSIIEEAAGVGKHRRRKERALRKIEATENNLSHLTDLLSEIRRQLKPLRNQAELAERHQQIERELASTKLILDCRELQELKQSLGEGDEDDLAGRAAALEAEVARLEERLTALRARREEVLAEYSQSRETHWRLAGAATRLASLERLAGERALTLSARLEATTEAAAGARAAELAQQLEVVEAQIVDAGEVAATQGPMLERAGQDRESARRRLFEVEAGLSSVRSARAKLRSELGGLLAGISSLESSRRAAEAEVGGLGRRLEQAAARLKAAEAGLSESASVTGAMTAERDSASAALEGIQAHHGKLEARRALLANRVSELQQQAAVTRAKGELASSGPNQAPGLRRAVEAAGGIGVLGELIRLDDSDRRSLEALLGPLSRVAVAADAAVAQRILERAAPEDRVTVLVARSSNIEVPEALPLSSVAEVGDPVAQSVLADLYLTPDAGTAIRLAGRHPHAGFLAPGAIAAWGARVSRAPADLALAVLDFENRLAEARVELEAIEAETAEAASRLVSGGELIRGLELKLAGAAGRARSDEVEAEAARSSISQAREAIRAGKDSIAALTARLDQDQASAVEVEAEKLILDHQIERLEDEQSALAEGVQQATEEWDRQRAASGRVEERLRLLEERRQEISEALEAANAAAGRVAGRRAQLEAWHGQAWRVGSVAEILAEQVGAWVAEAQAASEAAGLHVKELDASIAETAAAAKLTGGALESVSFEARRQELGRAETRARQRLLEEKMREEWGAEPSALSERLGGRDLARGPDEGEVLDRLAALDDQALMRKRSRLEKDLDVIGNVNPLAAEQATALEERESFLQGQMDDVRASRRDLLRIVDSVDGEILALFSAAFEEIAAQYERLFAALFPAGRGRLVLSDPADALGSGVEVQAAPSGRTLKRLSLLSGGERALSAMAILFAVFSARPSPFYILDEVEAALDDVNLVRFLGLLRQFRESQLLVITHQKRTMEVADVLYGVAIRPDGVSRVISQRLGDLLPAVTPVM